MGRRRKPIPRARSKSRVPGRGGRLEKVWLNGNLFQVQSNLEDFADQQSKETLTRELAERTYQRLGQGQPFDGWSATATASQTAVVMDRFGSADHQALRRAIAGSVTRLELVSDNPQTAGSCTVDLYIDGVLTELGVTLDSEETETAVASAAKGEYEFGINDPITLRFTTDGAWLPITAKIYCLILIEE